MSGKYNVGDKFVIEITKKHHTDDYCTQYYSTDNGLFLSERFLDNAEQVKIDPTDEADWWSDGYNSGLNDAWEAARKIIDRTSRTINAFGMGVPDIFNRYTASEAIAKIREYEEKQKAEERSTARQKVEALADEIGINNLYSIAREIRGE